MKELNGKEVAQMVIDRVTNAKDYTEAKIGRYMPDVPGKGWKKVPAGHAWISNFDVEDLWNSKANPNLKPQCYKIIEVLEKFVAGVDNKTMNKSSKPRKTVAYDLNNYYSEGDVVMLADSPFEKDDDKLFIVTKVEKMNIYLQELPNETNYYKVLNSIKCYGEAVSWTRVYKVDDFNARMNGGCKKFSAKDVGVRVYKGKLLVDEYYKVFDAKTKSFPMKTKQPNEKGEIVLKNDKYWND